MKEFIKEIIFQVKRIYWKWKQERDFRKSAKAFVGKNCKYKTIIQAMNSGAKYVVIMPSKNGHKHKRVYLNCIYLKARGRGLGL